VFDAAMHQRATERLAIAGELRTAIEGGELRLVYQPQIDLETHRIVGVEALVRWAHPTRGMLGPIEFIGVAEETQLIVPLGSWVMWEACRQAASWARAHPDHPDLQLCVNVSAQQLGRAELVDAVRGALDETGLDPGCLHLEITESVLMGESDFFLEALLGLKLLGVKIAIDDFGTGYSSLAYLRRFPIDVIKVDKGFVDGLGTDDSRAHAVVAAVIDLAHALELTAVAEGVETPQQVGILERLGCDVAQGYHFDRPLPPSEIDERLAADVPRGAR
jgi:EAL domain-containing protein (putative c-di-GMP-specific phosphodiesterase class I)